MSVRVSTLVWERSRAAGSDLVMLLAIADFANERGTAYPSIATLARKSRMQERNARYVLARLAASGELAIDLNAGPKGCNLFRITVGESLQTLAALQPSAPLQDVAPPAEDCPLQPASTTPAGACTKPLQRIAPEPSLNRQEPSLKTLSGKPDGVPALPSPARQVLDYLNERAGRDFRAVKANLSLILARLQSGVSIEQCRQVIDAKVVEWGSDPKMCDYLRPKTLFAASNFEQYLGTLGALKKGGSAKSDALTPDYVRAGFGSADEMARAQVAA